MTTAIACLCIGVVLGYLLSAANTYLTAANVRRAQRGLAPTLTPWRGDEVARDEPDPDYQPYDYRRMRL